MQNVNKVIEVLCEKICENHDQMTVKDVSDLTQALADLVVAKSQAKQLEIDINEITFQATSKILKQIEESKSDGTKVRQDISNKKSNKPSTEIEVDIKVEHKELDESIEKANQLVELLREAQKIVDSLSGKKCTSDKDQVLEAFILASKEIITESESLV